MNSPEELYKTLEQNSDNYLVVNNALSAQDLETCVKAAESLQQGLQVDEDGRPYYGQLFDPVELLGEDHFFSKLDTKKIAEIYGLEHLDAADWEIAADGKSFNNDFHNDIKYFKQHITIQWYLLLEDESRKFHISNQFGDFEYQPNGATQQELNTVTNTMLAFKATPTSFHGFKSGEGRRYNIRLRLYEGLRVPNRIHNFDKQNNVCWLIDWSNFNIDGAVENFEGYLARQTYNCLLANNHRNIVLFNDKNQLSTLVDKLKEYNFDKCIVVSAGCCVEKSTVDCLTDEYNTDNWLIDLREKTNQLVTSLTPTLENWAAYFYVCEYPCEDKNFIRFKSSPNISSTDKEILTHMSTYVAKNVLPYFEQPQVNTLTLDAR